MDAQDPLELFRKHAGMIHRIAYGYCRNPSDREEVLQEVAIELWRSRSRLDSRCREATWVYRVALNVAITHFRRERRHRAQLPLEQHAIHVVASEEPQPDDDLERMMAWIDTLAELDRALVLLHLEGNDHASIAEVLGISVSNVGTRLSRVRLKLRTAHAGAQTRSKDGTPCNSRK